MGAVDVEVILDEIKSGLKTRLNDKISAIEAEKADQYALNPIVDDAYTLQTLSEKVMAYDPFVFIWLEDISTVGSGPQALKKYTIVAAILKSDNGQDANISRVMFRYGRALEETLQSYFAGIRWGFRLTIESLVPVPFTRMNSDDTYRAVGVSIMVSMA